MLGSIIKTFYSNLPSYLGHFLQFIMCSLKNQPRQLPWLPWWWWRPCLVCTTCMNGWRVNYVMSDAPIELKIEEKVLWMYLQFLRNPLMLCNINSVWGSRYLLSAVVWQLFMNVFINLSKKVKIPYEDCLRGIVLFFSFHAHIQHIGLSKNRFLDLF